MATSNLTTVLARNVLSGTHGAMTYALLAATGFNLRDILRGYTSPFCLFGEKCFCSALFVTASPCNSYD